MTHKCRYNKSCRSFQSLDQFDNDYKCNFVVFACNAKLLIKDTDSIDENILLNTQFILANRYCMYDIVFWVNYPAKKRQNCFLQRMNHNFIYTIFQYAYKS